MFLVRQTFPDSKVLGLNVGDIQRIPEKWGPSTCTCVGLSRSPDEDAELATERIEVTLILSYAAADAAGASESDFTPR